MEDRADVAEEYEFYLHEKEEKRQQQSAHRGSGAEDVRMGGADDAMTPVHQQQQRATVRNMTRSRIGLGNN